MSGVSWKRRFSIGALSAALIVTPLCSDAQRLFYEESSPLERAAPVCRALASTDRHERAQWLRSLGEGSRLHLIVSVEMAELGIISMDENTRWARLVEAFDHPVARHNILFRHYRAYLQGALDVALLHEHLGRFRAEDFQGEIGGASGYLYGLLAEATKYRDTRMMLEAYRYAGAFGNHDATVRYVNLMLSLMPQVAQQEVVARYLRRVITDASDHYIAAMQYRAQLWAQGFFGGAPQIQKFNADLYASVAALTPDYLSGTIRSLSDAQQILRSSGLQVTDKVAEAALAYLRTRNVRHVPPSIGYRMICPWDVMTRQK